MSRSRDLVLTLLAAAFTAAAPEEPHVDFKVVAWYDRASPVATFRYQSYDLRKGDYTPAVDQWIAMMRSTFPHYEVVVRDVDLSHEEGPTDTRKVGAVIHRELLAAAAAEGLFLNAAPSVRDVVAREPFTRRLAPIEQPSTVRFAPPTWYAIPWNYPFPVPYPRPFP
ncbi:hypothetical protein [Paludisphaera rhizosphaerae]|uniref:hypothetical protein n=1 Tax=Paludisphaera rhizosphaerae TaxID=2711216 RepID=UPI0013ECF806|nr:hypothetical protein [Paludisphaera rhizosphaerae]